MASSEYTNYGMMLFLSLALSSKNIYPHESEV
jgi:hypothetical protein